MKEYIRFLNKYKRGLNTNQNHTNSTNEVEMGQNISRLHSWIQNKEIGKDGNQKQKKSDFCSIQWSSRHLFSSKPICCVLCMEWEGESIGTPARISSHYFLHTFCPISHNICTYFSYHLTLSGSILATRIEKKKIHLSQVSLLCFHSFWTKHSWIVHTKSYSQFRSNEGNWYYPNRWNWCRVTTFGSFSK